MFARNHAIEQKKRQKKLSTIAIFTGNVIVDGSYEIVPSLWPQRVVGWLDGCEAHDADEVDDDDDNDDSLTSDAFSDIRKPRTDHAAGLDTHLCPTG